eukprot:m.83428 g.83428  ORF g.83428 m.83428 type:complete len:429 (+) comp19636_c1_seq1:319-1605(+)
MGNCLSGGKTNFLDSSSPVKKGAIKPELYTALYDYNSPGSLHFRKGETLIVIGSEDRFTFIGHVQGQRQTGHFPATYVKRAVITSANPGYGQDPQFKSPTHTPTKRASAADVASPSLALVQSRTRASSSTPQPESGALTFVKSRDSTPVHQARSGRGKSPRKLELQTLSAPPSPRRSSFGSPGRSSGEARSIMKGSRPQSAAKKPARAKGIRFAKKNPPSGLTHNRNDYERAGHFDPARSQDQWESEEEAENQRMLEFRWYILERDLPPGSKCDEHLQFIEAARIQMEVEANDKEERRRRFRDARATARSKPHDGSAARNAAARANVGRGGAAVMRNAPNASFVSIDEDVGAPKPNLTDYESNDSFNHEGVTITELPVEPRRRSAMPSSRPTRRVPPPPTPPPSANSQPSPRSRMLQYTPDIDNDVHC